jgi:hypothetical protein
MTKITEGFQVGDLKLVLEPYIEIDMYRSKIGNDDEIVVVNFLVNDKQAAIDLVTFLECGYSFILDADISTSEIKPGAYLVFVEFLRRLRIIPQIFKIISDLSASSGINKDSWKFRYVTNEKFYPLSKENLKSMVPLTARAYKDKVVSPIEEMKKLSGILVYESIQDNMELQTIQHAAGIYRKPTKQN